MAKVLNQQTKNYLTELTNGKTEESEKLYQAVLRLRDLNEDAFSHCAYLIYSYQCPVEVAFLAFDIAYRQLTAGKNANPQRIFQSLSRNDRASYSAVKSLYDDAIRMLEKFVIQKEKEENLRNSEETPFINNQTNNKKANIPPSIQNNKIPSNEDITFAKNFLYESYFPSNEKDRYVVNTCIIPKNAWILNVYAISYEDYCNIVQNTVKEFNDAGITVFLTKPEMFKTENVSKENPKIAYSVLIGENFRFSELSENLILSFDSGEEILKMDGIKIAKRVSIDFVSFVGPLFMDNQRNVSSSNKKYIESFENEETILATVESIGTTRNIIDYHIENYTGINQKEKLSIYKPILCKKDDIIQIASILRNIETGKLDFLINSNREDIKILFIHYSHFSDFLSEINKQGIFIDSNPQFNEQ